jgi:hypothetical protein
MSSKITDGGSSQKWVHAWHGSHPCTRRPLGTRRTSLPACRLLCHLSSAVNRYRTPFTLVKSVKGDKSDYYTQQTLHWTSYHVFKRKKWT